MHIPVRVTVTAILAATALASSIWPAYAQMNTRVFKPQQFGASGSPQVLKCRTQPGQPRLQCETRGDFKAGEEVRLAQGGSVSTSEVPGAPVIKPDCTGGSCSPRGSATYQYEIAVVDKFGAVSQAGPAATISSAATLHGGGSTTAFNRLTWTPAPEAVGYLIYRSSEAEPMRLIDVSNGAYTNYKDYGRPPLIGANLPTSPPMGPEAGDLFTTIRMVSGSQITLADAPGVKAANILLMHDDTAALQRMFAAIPQSGARVVIPAGHYNLNICSAKGFAEPLMVSLFGKNNLTVTGKGPASVLEFKQCRNQYFGAFGYAFSTQPNQNGPGNFATTMYEHQQVEAIRPASLGQNTISLIDRNAATGFAAGDYVFVRTGQSLNPPYHEQPDAELHRVVAVDPAAGTIRLASPLAKNYAQECYGGSGPGTSTNCPPGARKAILGIANVTPATTHDITFSNLTMLADVKPLIFAASQIDGFHISNVTARVGNLLTVGDMHNLEIDHCHITDWDGTGEAFGAKGVSGVLVHDNTWEGLTSLAIQANEGTSDLKVHNNTFTTSGAPTSPAWNNVMGMRSRCHNVSITGNTFVNDIGAPIIRADPGCERVEVSNNVFSDHRAVNAGVVPAGSVVKGNHIQAPLKPIVDFQGHELSAE
jgi:hypothetical protein